MAEEVDPVKRIHDELEALSRRNLEDSIIDQLKNADYVRSDDIKRLLGGVTLYDYTKLASLVRVVDESGGDIASIDTLLA